MLRKDDLAPSVLSFNDWPRFPLLLFGARRGSGRGIGLGCTVKLWQPSRKYNCFEAWSQSSWPCRDSRVHRKRIDPQNLRGFSIFRPVARRHRSCSETGSLAAKRAQKATQFGYFSESGSTNGPV